MGANHKFSRNNEFQIFKNFSITLKTFRFILNCNCRSIINVQGAHLRQKIESFSVVVVVSRPPFGDPVVAPGRKWEQTPQHNGFELFLKEYSYNSLQAVPGHDAGLMFFPTDNV